MQEYIKKLLGSGTTTLIISSDEKKENLKIVQALEDSSLLLEGVREKIRNEAKVQKGGFLSMLLDTLGTILLGVMLIGKGINRARYASKGKRILRAGYGNKKIFNSTSLIL